MKESEKLRRDYVAERSMIWLFGIGDILLVLLAIWFISVGTQPNPLALYAILGVIAFLLIVTFSFIFGVHLPAAKRYRKLMLRWQWLESDSDDLPANLKKKYSLYGAALEVAEAYKKDVARMEERARSIRAELEAEEARARSIKAEIEAGFGGGK